MDPNNPVPNSLIPGGPDQNQPLFTKTKILLIAAAGLVIIGLIALMALGASKNTGTHTSPQDSPQDSASPSPSDSVTTNDQLPAEVLNIATKFTQARENAVGANQSSPFAWVNAVSSITAPSWQASHQPTNSTTGGGQGEYMLAHNLGYIVQADVSDCGWDLNSMAPTSKAGTVRCDLADDTVLRSSGQIVTGDALPFGWTHTGLQTPVELQVIKLNGVWVVSEDISGQGDGSQ